MSLMQQVSSGSEMLQEGQWTFRQGSGQIAVVRTPRLRQKQFAKAPPGPPFRAGFRFCASNVLRWPCSASRRCGTGRGGSGVVARRRGPGLRVDHRILRYSRASDPDPPTRS